MTFQKHAAGMIVFGILGIGTTIAPLEASARPSGFAAIPSPQAGGAVRPSFAASHSAHQSLQQAVFGKLPAHMRDFRMARPGDRRGGPGVPLWWAGSYLPSYPYGYVDPSGENPYAYPPMENFSERSRPVVTYQPGCRTDTQKVPSEGGGERTINITRCY
jgi:hypothetical protein